MFSKEELKKQIQDMGIKPSDTVLIHTSLRAVGEVENGADGVIDAFCEYLSDGLFLVPTHTWMSVNREHPVYDVRTAVPCIGTLPQVAAFRKDGVRSLHPTHSMWAHGKRAAEYVAGEEKATSPMPPGFAWARLAEVNAKILLLGVQNNRNSFIHAVDEIAELPDRIHSESYRITIYDQEGHVHYMDYFGHHCSRSDDFSRQFVNFEKPLVEMGAQTFGNFGNAQVRIIDAKKCQDVLLKIYSRAKEDLCIELMEIPEEYYR